MDRLIEPALRARIQAALDAIEREETVEILLAVESGSRAWGFPSRDSDYDVRFLYVRPIESYLAVTLPRDVIERPVDAVLDVNGWDLRKALQLMLRSNAVLIEWLTSPVRYRNWRQADALLKLARSAANLMALTYHYQHQTRHSFDAVGDGGETARLKSYCYALRSALAITWIRQRKEPPPMDVGTLMAGISLPDELVEQFGDVIARKAIAAEDALMPRSATFDGFIADALSTPVLAATVSARKEISTQADAFLAALLLDRADTTGASKEGSTCS
jgi:predicted nucleotidyltransferase